jgi:mannosyltransferase OCH1-like enzyme
VKPNELVVEVVLANLQGICCPSRWYIWWSTGHCRTTFLAKFLIQQRQRISRVEVTRLLNSNKDTNTGLQTVNELSGVVHWIRMHFISTNLIHKS